MKTINYGVSHYAIFRSLLGPRSIPFRNNRKTVNPCAHALSTEICAALQYAEFQRKFAMAWFVCSTANVENG
jgi:hypothetical protein